MSDLESLFAWDADPGQLARMRDQLRQRPNYPAAAQRLAANLLCDADEDPSLDAMLRDAGHNIAAFSAMYLHAKGDVTLPRLKTFIAGFGLVSPGRARSLLNYMRHLNYLEPDPAACSARGAPYRVTPQFLASYTRHEASLLDAIAVVEPAVSRLRENLGASGVLEALAIEQGDAFVAGNAQPSPHAAIYRAFLHRLAGIQVLHGLVAQAKTFPPAEELSFSASETARRLKVSRVHLGRILKEAEAQGFVTLKPGALRFTEAGLKALDWMYASRLSLHLSCASRVLKARPDLRAPAAA
jgi:hypothetical protein